MLTERAKQTCVKSYCGFSLQGVEVMWNYVLQGQPSWQPKTCILLNCIVLQVIYNPWEWKDLTLRVKQYLRILDIFTVHNSLHSDSKTCQTPHPHKLLKKYFLTSIPTYYREQHLSKLGRYWCVIYLFIFCNLSLWPQQAVTQQNWPSAFSPSCMGAVGCHGGGQGGWCHAGFKPPTF